MATAALTGTFVSTLVRPADIIAGGKTIIITLTSTTWVASGATFNAQRQNIINGLVSAQSEAHGWNAEVKAKIAVTDVVQTSSTVVTITLDAEASYAITNFTGTESITVTIPSTAVASGVAIVATGGLVVAPTHASFFVSLSGSDSNNGLSPDATTANIAKPWLTVGKALISGTTVLAGDIIWVAPGVYYSAGSTYSPVAAMSSTANPTEIHGDPTNTQGFKDSSSVLVPPGIVHWTTRVSSDTLDGPPLSNGALCAPSANNVSGLRFFNMLLEAKPSAQIFTLHLNNTPDFQLIDCRLAGNTIFAVTSTDPATAGRNWLFQRCIFIGNDAWGVTQSVAAATADADLNITFESCLLISTAFSTTAISASGGNLGGGVRYNDCTIICRSTPAVTTALRVSTVTPITFKGCLFIGCGAGLSSGTSGQIIDGGYNRFMCVNATAHTNVTAAGTSKFHPAPYLVLHDLMKWGLQMPRNDFFGWTDDAPSALGFSASGQTVKDFRGRTAKPWGAGASIGYMQAQAVAQDTGSAITGGGANSLKITGAGEVSFFVPVDATATTISVRTKSTSYGGTTWPSLVVVANGAIGLATDQTVSATSATEATITSPSFTPTAKGVVEVRLVSQSTSISSSTWFDIFASP